MDDFHKEYWNDIVKNYNNGDEIVVNKIAFFVDDEKQIGTYRGYDGRRFKIRFKDGTEKETTNLWYNGEVPDEYKDVLVDNAEFIPIN